MDLKIYISSNYSRCNEANELAKYFIESGHEILSLWHEEDKQPKCSLTQALRNIWGIQQCDLFILLSGNKITSGNRSFEFGVAYSNKKKIIVIDRNEKSLFELLPGISHYESIEELKRTI